MAISVTVEPLESALWPQGDIRDPLGVWGFRRGVTGDASGGGVKVNCEVPAARRSAYVYTCYSLNWAQLTGTRDSQTVRSRLLTNYPNIDPIPQVQGYATNTGSLTIGSANYTAPIQGVQAHQPLIQDVDRFVLLWDPRQQSTLGNLAIVEIEQSVNTDLATFSFEGYGYFWDRSVMQAPGGLRHPGSS